MTRSRTAARIFSPSLDHGTLPPVLGADMDPTEMLACHTGAPPKPSIHLLTVRQVITHVVPDACVR